MKRVLFLSVAILCVLGTSTAAAYSGSFSQSANGAQTITASSGGVLDYAFDGTLVGGGSLIASGTVTSTETVQTDGSGTCSGATGSATMTEDGSGNTLTMDETGCPSGGTYSITGGTGEFAGATGSGTFMVTDPTVKGATQMIWSGDVHLSGNADLSVVETDDGPVQQGADLTYTLTLNNKGPSAAAGVVIADQLAPGTRFVSASGGCTHQGSAVYCGAGTVSSGATGTFQVVMRADVPGKLQSSVFIASDNDDPNPADNTSVDTTTVQGVTFSFGPQKLATAGPVLPLVIATETGSPAAVTVEGANASDFQLISQNCAGASAQSGASCQANLRFQPGALGSRSATFRVTYADGSSITIPLIGSGTTDSPGSTDSGHTTSSQNTSSGGGGAGGSAGVLVGQVGNQSSPGDAGAATCRLRGKTITCKVTFAKSSSTARVVGTRVTRRGITYDYGKRSTKSRTFSITLKRKRRLRAGGYTLTLTVKNGAGHVLSTKRGALRIKKPKK